MTPLALYIHVPFCLHKCCYCDFYSTTRTSLLPRYLMAMQQEIAYYQRLPAFAGRSLSSLYLGGGTPSLLQPLQMENLLDSVRAAWPLLPTAEITLEANPGALDIRHLSAFHRAGINRLSLGVQSFHDHELQRLTRIHTATEAAAAIKAARENGFDNLNLDLIFGLPGQSLQDYLFSLQKALDSKPEHLSLYGLTIERETPLFREVQCGKVQPIDEEVEREMFLAGQELAAAAGFEQYEISNYALPGYSARHNQQYWAGLDYLGLGPAAHSFTSDTRWWNSRDIDQYLLAWAQNKPAVAGRENIGRKEERMEALLLGLRQSAGISLLQWQRRFGEDLLQSGARAIDKLGGFALGAPSFGAAPGEQLLTLTPDHLALTRAGLLLYDMVCRELSVAIGE